LAKNDQYSAIKLQPVAEAASSRQARLRTIAQPLRGKAHILEELITRMELLLKSV
jgi:hypothetical protein